MQTIDRDLKNLYPPFRELVIRGLAVAHTKGLYAYVFEGMRSEERQSLLYAQGRTLPGKIVTNAKPGYSLHQYGLAVDLVFDSDLERPGPQWTWTGDYDGLIKIMVGEGLEVLKFEKAHFQKTWGVSLASFRYIKQMQGLPGVWAYLDKLIANTKIS